MNLSKALYIMLFLLASNKLQSQQNNFNLGINLTGYERFWEDKELNYKDIIADINKLHKQGIKDIRLPVSFEYQFKRKSKRRFLRDLIKIVKYIRKKEMTLIVCYFDHTLDRYTNIETTKSNWKYISYKIKF